jgi:cell division protein FtsQ
MNPRIKGLIVIAAHITLLLAVGVFWLKSIQNARSLQTKKLKIEIIRSSQENELITDRAVKDHLNVFFKKDWRKLKLKSLRLKDLESYFNKMGVVHHAEFFFDASECLHVVIYQRDPIVRVIDISGNQFYIDIEGRKISNSLNYSARVPVATGQFPILPEVDIWKKGNVAYQSLFELAKKVAADPFSKALIEQIDLDLNGEFTLIPKIGHEKIIFGNVENVDAKLEKMQLFYHEGLRYEGWNVYKTIDLKNDNQVVCRKNISET